MNQLIVYSKNNCPACTRLKMSLMQKEVDFTEINIDTDPDAKTFLLQQGHRSVPQMYKGGIHIPDFSRI